MQGRHGRADWRGTGRGEVPPRPVLVADRDRLGRFYIYRWGASVARETGMQIGLKCLSGIPCRRRFGWGAASLRPYIYQVVSAVP